MFGFSERQMIMRCIRLIQIHDTQEDRSGFIVGLFRKFSVWYHRYRIMSFLHTLDDYPEERGKELWSRCVKAIIEILYVYREIVFTDPLSFKKIPLGVEVVPSGVVFNIQPMEDFSEVAAFISSIGTSEYDRYGISFRLYADTERSKPVYFYEFKILKSSEADLCRVVALFQTEEELDNSRSYPHVVSADIVYKAGMALGLAKTFHELSGYPIPVEVAGCLLPFIEARTYKY